jgi:hypothetical protein
VKHAFRIRWHSSLFWEIYTRRVVERSNLSYILRPWQHVSQSLSPLTMDVIQACLTLAPVPWLGPAFVAFRTVYDGVIQAQASKSQLTDLAESCAQLLVAVNGDGTDRTERQSSQHLADLHT